MPLIKRKKDKALFNSYPWAEVNRTLAGLNFGPPNQWPNFNQTDMNNWMNMMQQQQQQQAQQAQAYQTPSQSPVPFQQAPQWPMPQYAVSAPFAPSPVFGQPSPYVAAPPPMYPYAYQPAPQQAQPQPPSYGATRAFVSTPPPYMQAPIPPPQPAAPPTYAASWGKQ